MKNSVTNNAASTSLCLAVLSVSWLARSVCELFSKHCCSSTTLTMCYKEHYMLQQFESLLSLCSHIRQELATLPQEIHAYVCLPFRYLISDRKFLSK